MAVGHELPRGVRSPPGNFLNEHALRCNLMHFGAQFVFHSCTIFEAYLINSLQISEVQFSNQF